MRIVSFPEADVPRELRAQVRALHDEAWPDYKPERDGPVHDPALRPLSMLLLDGDRVLSALDILSKQIHHRGQAFDASGLSTVVTGKANRGKGHGHRLVQAARDAIEASGADLGIFTCDSPLQAFYERGGWQLLPGTVLVGGTPEAPFPERPVRQGHHGALLLAASAAPSPTRSSVAGSSCIPARSTSSGSTRRVAGAILTLLLARSEDRVKMSRCNRPGATAALTETTDATQGGTT